jgi:hypothetical protein
MDSDEFGYRNCGDLALKQTAELWFELIRTQHILRILLEKVNAFPRLDQSEEKFCDEKAFEAVQNKFKKFSGVMKVKMKER